MKQFLGLSDKEAAYIELPALAARRDSPCGLPRLISEDLVAFRDSNNKIGVVEAHCPHLGRSVVD